MRHFRGMAVCTLVTAVTLVGFAAPRAEAYNDFYKVFKKKYLGDESKPEQVKLAAAIKEVKKCNVCHDPRKIDGKASKKNHNEYGQALAELLSKKDKKDIEKITKALDEVEKIKAANSDKTYGEKLSAGELPVVIKP